MKKITVLLLSLIICFAFFGCSADISTENTSASVLESNITSEITTVNESTAALPDDTKTESKAKETERKSTTEKSTSKTSSTAVKTTTGTTKATIKTTTSKATTAKPFATTTKKTSATVSTKKTATTTTTEKSTAKQTTTSSTITCTVTIECKSVLGNMDNLKAGHESYVPSDGYMINCYTVTVPDGSTAYDAVKFACDNQNVSMNVSNSSFGKYIAGFNNIDEKDCGGQSGWIYFVNGASPSKSCDRYTLSNGDNVVFSYTCS